ncbi:hypothetical protein [Aquincola sp. J276]|uniref:hypothetical protein n=1 Tax=Aquincola sp. J276 TaxID=2898432 RepID=UPI0021515315|nr:hypothetical protein [Aquincola sp. J276]MCR5864087.1 hypothetical protein [Aquincola sp. J276]
MAISNRRWRAVPGAGEPHRAHRLAAAAHRRAHHRVDARHRHAAVVHAVLLQPVVTGYVSMVPMAGGNGAWLSIVRKVPAHVAALSPVLVPVLVVALVTCALLDGDPLGRNKCLAMVLCVSGVAVNLRPR